MNDPNPRLPAEAAFVNARATRAPGLTDASAAPTRGAQSRICCHNNLMRLNI
jgi:hypothetical protein